MAEALSGKIVAQTALRLTNALDMSTPKDNLMRQQSCDIQSGGGQNQMNKLWHDSRLLGPGSHDNLGLVSSLQDAFGQTVNFAAVKYVNIRVSDLTSGSLVFCNSVAARFGGIVSLGATLGQGGWHQYLWPSSAGWVVTSGSNSTIRISGNTDIPSGQTLAYDIMIGGYG